MPKTTKTSAGSWASGVVRVATSGAAVVMSRLPPGRPVRGQASSRSAQPASSRWDEAETPPPARRLLRGQTPPQRCADFVTELRRWRRRLARKGEGPLPPWGQLVKGSDPWLGARRRLRYAARVPTAVDLDPPSPERVDSAPAARDVEQLEMVDPRRERRVDDEVIAHRLEPEHRPQQEKRRASRPRLRAARGWVLHRVLCLPSLVTAERLRQTAVEELSRVQDPGRDRRRFVLEAVPPQAPGDERVVERPDSPDVVADRVEARLALGQRAHAPAGEEPRPHQMPDDRLRLRLVDDPAPEQMAVVRRERVDLLAVEVQGEREVLVVLDPEVAVEATLEIGGLPLKLVGELRIVPDAPRKPSRTHLRVVRVALELGRGPREPGEPPVAVRDRVPRVLPALVLEAGLLVAPLVPDVAVVLEIGVLVDPVQRRPRLELEIPNELPVAGPPLVLVEQHDVEGRRVRAAVVRRVRALLEGGQLAVTQLVQDPAGILVPEIVEPRPLPLAEREQRGARQLGRERQGLEAREDAVAAEHRHEPGQTRGRQAPASRDRRREPQRGQVDEAAAVRPLQRLPVALDPRRAREPTVEVRLHRLPAPTLRLNLHLTEPRHLGYDVEVGRPLAVPRDFQVECQPVRIHLGPLAARDQGRALVRSALVAKPQRAFHGAARVAALLLEGVLDLEQVGEVAGGLDPHAQPNRLVAVVEDRQRLAKTGGNRPLPDHRELRVDVDRPYPWDEEEARLEVLQVVDRERVQPFAVDGQDPLREEARVIREQARGVGQRRLDVAAVVADDERVAVEHLDELVAHRRRHSFSAGLGAGRLDAVPGSRRWKRTSSLGSPSIVTAPRSTAANAFTFPFVRPSNSFRSARRTQSAGPLPRETATSPLSTVTRQRSVRLPPTSSRSIVPLACFSTGT